MAKVLLLLFLLMTANVHAQVFQLKVTDYDGLDSINAFKVFLDGQVKEIENKINAELPSSSAGRIMRGVADSNVIAAKGIGTDYTSQMDVSVIGLALGAGADFEDEKGTKSDTSGYAGAPGLMIGFNLGALGMRDILDMDSNKLNMYINAMSTKYVHKLADNSNERTLIGLDMTSVGVHFRYHLVDKSETHPKWGGLKFHWGYEYNTSDYTYETRLDRVVNIIGDNELIQGRITGTPKGTIEVRTHSFPLAVSTDYQLLPFLNVYGGTGMDFNMGGAKGSALANGNASPVLCTGGSCGPGRTLQLQAQANLDTSSLVTPITIRAFAGFQVSISHLSFYLQGDKELKTELMSATTGIRLFY